MPAVTHRAMVTRFAGALRWPSTVQHALRVYLLGLMVCIFVPLWLQGCGGGGGSDSSQAVTGVATQYGVKTARRWYSRPMRCSAA
jgi:hypothetical protein